jgi:cephalosporin-C deacetylase-like acetyl esterase
MKDLTRLVYFILIIALNSCSVTNSKTEEPVNKEASNNIFSYLIKEAKKITDSSLNGINSLDGWNSIRAKKYNEYIEMMGLKSLPLNGKRSDLHVKVTGTIQKDGYRIEKLYYESLPGLYVPANLYIPDKINGKAPAILYVCGHEATQKEAYQEHPRKFAQLGFVSLIIETIQLGEVRGEHHGTYSNGWFNWYSRGYTPGGVELWNAIRGIDLLCSRPEVDANNIGVTGISGGGSQSWFIAAADPRVKATAAICGASTLEAQLTSRTIDGHCDCMMPINTYLIDFQNIGALIAPRAFLIGQADRDGWFTLESVHRLHDDVKKIYDLYGASGKIGFVESPGGHSYHKISRQRINSFFIENLMGKKVSPESTGDIDESPEAHLSVEELKAYVNGVPADDRTTKIQDSFIPLHQSPALNNEKELIAYRDSVKTLLKEKTFHAFPKIPTTFDPVLLHRTKDFGKFGRDYYSFVPEEGWRLKVDIHWENDPKEKKPLMIVLRNPDTVWKSADADKKGANQLIGDYKEGRNIAFFDVRGVGETGWDQNQQWHIRRSAAWIGRTIASMQVYDVLRCIEFCRTLKGVDPEKIGIAADGPLSVVALYAALLDGKCSLIILNNPPETQDVASSPDGKGAAIEMLNCLQITDLKEMPALLAPSKVIINSGMPDSWKWSEEVLKRVNSKQ